MPTASRAPTARESSTDEFAWAARSLAIRAGGCGAQEVKIAFRCVKGLLAPPAGRETQPGTSARGLNAKSRRRGPVAVAPPGGAGGKSIRARRIRARTQWSEPRSGQVSGEARPPPWKQSLNRICPTGKFNRPFQMDGQLKSPAASSTAGLRGLIDAVEPKFTAGRPPRPSGAPPACAPPLASSALE